MESQVKENVLHDEGIHKEEGLVPYICSYDSLVGKINELKFYLGNLSHYLISLIKIMSLCMLNYSIIRIQMRTYVCIGMIMIAISRRHT